jgi:hypothetical protein
MENLETRQKVILGIMVIAILYVAVDFLIPKKKDSAMNLKQKQEELNTFMATMTATLGKNAPQNLGLLIFSRAEKEWPQDPFLDEKSHRSWIQARTMMKEKEKDTNVAPKIEFTYTGFIEVGGKRMAIVNGNEYKEGEALDIKGYVLTSVSPTSVVIVNRATRAEQKVSLQE